MAQTHGFVVAKMTLSKGNNPGDPDKLPDEIGATSLRPKFTRTESQYVIGDPLRFVSQGAIEGAVMPNGDLTGDVSGTGAILADATPGIWLTVGTYKVLLGAGFPGEFLINVTAAYTAANPLVLMTAIDYSAPVATLTQILALPAGATNGQGLEWVDGSLRWVDKSAPAAGSDLALHVDDTNPHGAAHSGLDFSALYLNRMI